MAMNVNLRSNMFFIFLAALYHRRAAQCTHHGNRNLSNNFDSRVLQ